MSPSSLQQLPLARGEFLSLGHAGGLYLATVRASSSLWVATHKRADDSSDGPTFAIRTGAGSADPSSFCYFVAEPSGQLLRSGPLSDCIGCHAAADAGAIFSSHDDRR